MRNLIVLTLALAACGPASISGKIDGETVASPRSAAFDEVTIDLGPLGEYKALTIFVTDVGDACQVFDDFYSNIEWGCDEQCEDWSRIAQDELGKDEYWSMSLTLVADPDRVEGEFAFADGLEENHFDGSLTRWDVSTLYDETTCVSTCQDGADVLGRRVADVTAGSVEVTAYESGEAFDGKFDVTLSDDDLKGSFRATRCDQMSDWF